MNKQNEGVLLVITLCDWCELVVKFKWNSYEVPVKYLWSECEVRRYEGVVKNKLWDVAMNLL